MASSAKKDRITAYVSDNAQSRISEAAELSGATLSQFLVAAAMKEAERVIENEKIVRLDVENAKRFFGALDDQPEPAPSLVQFIKTYA